MIERIRQLAQLPEFDDLAQRNQARVIRATVGVSTLFLLLISIILMIAPDRPFPIGPVTLMVGLVVSSELLLRRKQTVPASVIIITLYVLLTSYIMFFTVGDVYILYPFFLIIVILGGLLLGRTGGLTTAIVAIIIGLLHVTVIEAGYIRAADGSGPIEAPILFYAFFAPCMLFVAALQSVALGGIQDEITSLIREQASLEQGRHRLAQNVAERVKDLDLVSEVSRTISRIRNLDELLARSVDLIRERYDLYYAQIYLPSELGQILSVRAGTGAVGRRLMELGHRLPIQGDSINGTAAIEKRTVILHDTRQSTAFRPNDMLPDTRSAVSVPLMAGDSVVGVLNLQSDIPGNFTEENVTRFDTLAGQLAIAIENVALFNSAQQIQRELSAQSEQLAQDGWGAYLDGINRPEQIGYTFDRVSIEPLSHAPEREDESVHTTTIAIAGYPIGEIEVDASVVDDDAAELLAFVSQLVAQQVENLRLLDDAQRYRAEAEESIRRTTRLGWETYVESNEIHPAYVYDGVQVEPVKDDHLLELPNPIEEPLEVQGELIGTLAMTNQEELTANDAQLVRSVAERLSLHIENLRLNAQTQQALTQTEALFQGGDRIVRAGSIQDGLVALVESTTFARFDWVNVLLFEHSWERTAPKTMDIIAAVGRSGLSNNHVLAQIGACYEISPFKAHLHRRQPTIFVDVTTDERADEALKGIVVDQMKMRATVIFPLVAGGSWFGIVMAQNGAPISLNDDDLRQLTSLTDQTASVFRSLLLFEDAQKRAQQERRVRDISDKIRRGKDRSEILRIAREELAELLGAKQGHAQLGTESQLKKITKNGQPKKHHVNGGG